MYLLALTLRPRLSQSQRRRRGTPSPHASACHLKIVRTLLCSIRVCLCVCVSVCMHACVCGWCPRLPKCDAFACPTATSHCAVRAYLAFARMIVMGESDSTVALAVRQSRLAYGLATGGFESDPFAALPPLPSARPRGAVAVALAEALKSSDKGMSYTSAMMQRVCVCVRACACVRARRSSPPRVPAPHAHVDTRAHPACRQLTAIVFG